jgi:hypothetical protein
MLGDPPVLTYQRAGICDAVFAAVKYARSAARRSALSFARGAISSTATRHSESEYLLIGSGAWHAEHGPVKMRLPSLSVSTDAPCATVTIAGVTGGAAGAIAAQPPSANAQT